MSDREWGRRDFLNHFALLGAALVSMPGSGWAWAEEGPTRSPAADVDEFRIKRQEVFEFTEKPSVSRDGDKVTIRFASKGYCDATVAIEDAAGQSRRIVRHLASGVMGPNAPMPFQKDSLSQTLVWDGKDDRGRYVDDKTNCSVRVSLGLKPRFERTLYWSPARQYGGYSPLLAATEKGVYVFDGRGVDHLRLFDHEGNYAGAVYPFPAAKLGEVQGLTWHDFPQGDRLPLKTGFYQNTLLTCGANDSQHTIASMSLRAATGLAATKDRIALGGNFLGRLAADGTTGGLPLKGPAISFTGKIRRVGQPEPVSPSSLAFSPDGKRVYMTGFLWHGDENGWGFHGGLSGAIHCVTVMDYEKDDAPRVFAGVASETEAGTDNAHLRVPTSVATDPQGRVYVSDFLNDRIQVFAPDGKHLKTIPVNKPARVLVHKKTGDIYVFSWATVGISFDLQRETKYEPYWKWRNEVAVFTHLGPFDDPTVLATAPVPFELAYCMGGIHVGAVNRVELDSWAAEPTFWLASPASGQKGQAQWADGKPLKVEPWQGPGIWIVSYRDGQWIVKRNFGDDAHKSTIRTRFFAYNIQHLFVSPETGLLYVGEADSGPAGGKAFNQLVEVDPETGRAGLVDLPFNPMDMAFDGNGLAYLRSQSVVMRFDPVTWKEVPWDYGEELSRVGDDGSIGGHATSAVAGLVLPATGVVCYHQGGMGISPRGHLVVACGNRSSTTPQDRREGKGEIVPALKPYTASLFPGRAVNPTSCSVHIWDEHGHIIHEDAVPGLPQLDGVHIDKDDNLYLMATPTRVLNGKRYFDHMSETLMKFQPKQGKVLAESAPLELTADLKPKRPADLSGGLLGSAWAEGAEWSYGGLGFAGFNAPIAPSCACWFPRFTLDYFARSFAPAVNRYCVDVLDGSGNLIVRIGRPGNVDDGAPLFADGGPPHTRPIGGDEVALFHPCFAATHTDRRLFIADFGNARIVSVNLDYHATERVPVD